MPTPTRVVFFDGDRESDDLAQFKDAGFEIVISCDVAQNTREEIGRLIAWVCENAECVYLGAGWRRSKVSRAIRQTAIATGIRLRGFS